MPCIVHETPDEIAENARRAQDKITGPLHSQIQNLTRKLAERDAMLCAVLTVFEEGRLTFTDDRDDQFAFGLYDLYHEVDWEEAGVSKSDMVEWWKDHKEQDAKRQAQEAAKLAARRKRALEKLTSKERLLLGL